MKKTLLSAFTALAFLTGSAQEKSPLISIIPEPQSVQQLDGQVIITPRMKYFTNSESAERAATLFNTFLDANYGISLEKGTMQNSTLIFSDDEALPKEGYQLTATR